MVTVTLFCVDWFLLRDRDSVDFRPTTMASLSQEITRVDHPPSSTPCWHQKRTWRYVLEMYMEVRFGNVPGGTFWNVWPTAARFLPRLRELPASHVDYG